MNEFLSIVISFPTVVFSALLVLILAYWMFVILGALDLELFDFDLEVDFDLDVDVDVDVEVDADVDSDVDAGGHGAPIWVQALAFLGVGRIPFMIVATGVVVSSFVFSYLIVALAGPYVVIGAMIGSLMMALAFLLSYPTTALMMRPLRGVFELERQRGGHALIGELCHVTTGDVSDSFGQAKLHYNASDLLISIRADKDNGLKRGARALIVSFDDEHNQFWVEPYAAFEASELVMKDQEAEERVTVSEAS